MMSNNLKSSNQTRAYVLFTTMCILLWQMGFDFAGKAVYSAVWIAAVSLFMELLGFSTQKWVTAGGLGTVLLTLAGREVQQFYIAELSYTFATT